MEFLEFSRSFDMNEDEVFTFHPIGNVEAFYETKIVIDWLNIDLEDKGLVIKTHCNCKDHQIRKRQCKHIKECINVLVKRGVLLREEPLERFFCTVCKIGIDTQEYSVRCGYCGLDIVKPKSKDEQDN